MNFLKQPLCRPGCADGHADLVASLVEDAAAEDAALQAGPHHAKPRTHRDREGTTQLVKAAEKSFFS